MPITKRIPPITDTGPSGETYDVWARSWGDTWGTSWYKSILVQLPGDIQLNVTKRVTGT